MSISHELLSRSDGDIAFDVAGDGPLVVCVPGMGELRSSYRFLAPTLVDAGFRVAVADLRGHGDSDAGFNSYGDEATASDIVALVEELGGPAIVVGNSLAAGSAVLAAAARPELVSGLVLVGPFVRDPTGRKLQTLMFRALMAPLWARTVWSSYLPKLYAGQKPADFDAYRASVKAALAKPGHTTAFSRTTRTTHAAAEAALPSVSAPTLVVMGELDPDFPEPRAEAEWVAAALRAELVMVPEAGHYSQSQRPDLVGPAVAAFAQRVRQRHA